MDITFINPNVYGVVDINLGLAYVVASVKKGHRVRLLDLTFGRRDYLPLVREELLRHRPDAVCFSVNSFTFAAAAQMAAAVRELCPGVPVVFGGVHPTLLPEETIAHPCVDAVCIGEGEKALPEYLSCLERGVPPAVAGIWYKDGSGAVVRNPLRPFEREIDALPFPDWGDWAIEKYLDATIYSLPGALKMLASRGCPYNCSFCSSAAIKKNVPGEYYRPRAPRAMVEEIAANAARFASRGFRSLVFCDAVFGLELPRLAEFCRLYAGEGLHRRFKWDCETRAELITDEWARTAAAGGCVFVSLGVETGDDAIRNGVYRKGITTEAIRAAAAHLKRHGIAYGFYMMVGCPQDSRATIESGIRLVRELDPVKTCFRYYHPMPKTALAGTIGDDLWKGARRMGAQENTPRLRTRHLSMGALALLMWRIRFGVLLRRFFQQGWKYGGARFLLDVARFVVSPGGFRKLPRTSPHIKSELEQKTIMTYILEGRRPAR